MLIERLLVVYQEEHFRRPSVFCRVAGHQDADSTAMSHANQDPICGMWITPETAAAKRTRRGQKNYFLLAELCRAVRRCIQWPNSFPQPLSFNHEFSEYAFLLWCSWHRDRLKISGHTCRRTNPARLCQFQGLKQLRLRNWDKPPFEPSQVSAIVLSHAHIDHSGLLPLIVRRGYRGPIYCTRATASLLPILLRDAAHLQEEDARYANKRGFSKHHPAEPLFSLKDVEKTLPLVEPCGYLKDIKVTKNATVTFRRTAHILGAASIDLLLSGEKGQRLVDSGDLGRWNRPMLRDPEFVPEADVLLVESTYGDRFHPKDAPTEGLARIINDAVSRGGPLIIPAFAIGRTQELIWRIRELELAGRIPGLPVFIDSPNGHGCDLEVFCQASGGARYRYATADGQTSLSIVLCAGSTAAYRG
jgi:hypothetical protein